MNKRAVLIAWGLLVFAVLACNRTVPTSTPQVETSAPPVSASTQTPAAATETSAVGTTPSPVTTTPVTGTPACIHNTDFVADVTISDDTELNPGTEFVKTWRVRNSGTCAWESGTAWGFESGDQMGGPDSVSVPVVEPGTTTDVSVNLTAPETAGTFTGYWRTRRPNGERFGTPIYVRIVVVDDRTTPTPTASPTATAEPGVGPNIKFFESDVPEADPGDTLHLQWETENATTVTLYHLMPTGQLGSFWEVKASGVFTYEIDPSERNRTGFVLFAGDDQGHIAQETLLVPLRCPDTWFFTPAPDSCPASAAIISDAAEEHFEHGTMIWVREQDLIYVLFDDDQGQKWSAYPDEWETGDPKEDPALTPPAGLYQPVRGFGLLWREEPGVRERLGWAVDLETSFTTAVQSTSRPKYNDTYIRALDGKVWKLLPWGSEWTKVP